MECDIVYCTKDEPFESVRQKMLGKKLYKMLPVVDESIHLVDVISIVSILESGMKKGKKS